MISIWSLETELDKREKLMQDIKVDVVVIGAGMAGILNAYFLQQKGLNIVVIEANEIASGVTKNTTAKITSQHDLIYDSFISKIGKELAGQYARANEQAIKLYKKIIEEKKIDCNFEEKPAYIYTRSDITPIEKEVKAASSLQINVEFTKKSTLPFAVEGMVKFDNQAQFQPLDFLKAIAKELTIYEHTKALSIEDQVVYTENGNITADHIIMATHYPFINAPGYYFTRLYQDRSYVIALDNAGQLDGMYKDADSKGYSFRNYKNLLLLGGASHKTGKNKDGGNYEKLRKAAKDFYRNSTEKYHWSAQDCMSLDNIPYIGRFSSKTPNLYVATGFHKWGMTSSMVSAMILSDMIIGKTNDYMEVFDPKRFHLSASMNHLVTEVEDTISSQYAQYFKYPKEEIDEIEKGHGAIVDYNGQKIGVYKDEEGKVYMVTTKCAHLGCQLEWNRDERSWDCPCHGSRYDYKGNVIDNPAMKGIAIEKELNDRN